MCVLLLLLAHPASGAPSTAVAPRAPPAPPRTALSAQRGRALTSTTIAAGDTSALQAALANSAYDEIQLEEAEYEPTTVLSIERSVVVAAAVGGSYATLDGGWNNLSISCEPWHFVQLIGLDIGSIYINGGNVNLTDCKIHDSEVRRTPSRVAKTIPSA